MKNYILKDLYLINTASFIAFVGEAVTWSGVPYLLVILTGSHENFAVMFIISQSVRIIVPFISRKIVDLFSKKNISISTSICAVFILMLLVNIDYNANKKIFLTLVVILWIVFYSGEASRSVWQGNIIKELNFHIEEGMAKFNSVNMIGKIIGFGLGPIIFSYLKNKGFLIEAIGYSIECGLLFLVSYNKIVLDTGKYIKITWKFIRENSNYFWLISLSNIFVYPELYINQSVLQLKFAATDKVISLYWVLTSIASVCGYFILSKGVLRRLNQNTFYIYVSFIQLLIFSAMIFSHNIYMSIFLGCMFTFLNPALNVLVSRELFLHFPDYMRVQILSLSNSFTSVVSVVFIIFIKNINITNAMHCLILLIISLGIVIFRNIKFSRYNSSVI